MTAEEFWKSWLAIGFLAGPGVLGFVSVAYSQYLRRHHLEAIKHALKNSRYIYLWGPSLGRRGWICSMLEIAKITQMITLPRSSLHTGELDADDLEHFPVHLKRLLRIDLAILTAAAVWLVVVCAVLNMD